MMGRLSKLIVVDNLECPKCKRNFAEFLKKKKYPQIKRICWNLLTLIVSGLLQLSSKTTPSIHKLQCHEVVIQ
jgi:hypothetical protein